MDTRIITLRGIPMGDDSHYDISLVAPFFLDKKYTKCSLQVTKLQAFYISDNKRPLGVFDFALCSDIPQLNTYDNINKYSNILKIGIFKPQVNFLSDAKSGETNISSTDLVIDQNYNNEYEQIYIPVDSVHNNINFYVRDSESNKFSNNTMFWSATIVFKFYE